MSLFYMCIRQRIIHKYDTIKQKNNLILTVR